jgi:hypothetical protein
MAIPVVFNSTNYLIPVTGETGWGGTLTNWISDVSGHAVTLVDIQTLSNKLVLLQDGTVSTPCLSFPSDTNTGIYHPATDQIAITTNGAQRLLVDASGNVTIGGALAAGSTTITGTLAVTGAFSATSSTISGAISAGSLSGTVTIAPTSGNATLQGTGTTSLSLGTATNGEMFRINDKTTTNTKWLDLSFNSGTNSFALVASGTANLTLQPSGGGALQLYASTISLTTSGGPTLRSGTGAATGTQPKGSIWIRTDGAVGSTIYISQGAGTWNAVAGV